MKFYFVCKCLDNKRKTLINEKRSIMFLYFTYLDVTSNYCTKVVSLVKLLLAFSSVKSKSKTYKTFFDFIQANLRLLRWQNKKRGVGSRDQNILKFPGFRHGTLQWDRIRTLFSYFCWINSFNFDFKRLCWLYLSKKFEHLN